MAEIATLFAEQDAATLVPAVTEVRTATGIVLHEGENYAGLVFDAETGKPSHHLILLPSEVIGAWGASKDWATSINGDLPTRQEQSILLAQLKRLFSPAWHWSAGQYSVNGAWAQNFLNGTQYDVFKDRSLRARAVRRLPFNFLPI